MLLRALLYFIANAAVIFGLSFIFPQLVVRSWSDALIFVFVLTLFNYTITPILKLLALPITIVTLGIFNFFINILVIWFTIDILEGVEITGGNSNKFFISLLLVIILGVVTQTLEKDKRRD